MSLITPWKRAAKVSDISVAELVEAGVTCVLIDRDNTVVPRDTKRAPKSALEWLDELRAAGIKICMVSNNFHTAEVEASAAELEMDVVHHAMKPAPFAVKRALSLMGAAPSQAVLVGDQVFTDVMAGNLSGVRPILVEPQSTTDLWYTQIFRVVERAIGARK